MTDVTVVTDETVVTCVTVATDVTVVTDVTMVYDGIVEIVAVVVYMHCSMIIVIIIAHN